MSDTVMDSFECPGGMPLRIDRGFFFLDEFEYTFDIDGAQLFPNDTLKHRILSEYKQSVYNISRLDYVLLEHTINASDVQIMLDPSRIDDTKSRFNVHIRADIAELQVQV